MALTYAQLSQAIQDYLEEDETSFVSNIPVFVRQAEDRILNAVQLPVFRRMQTGAMTADNRFLDYPDDFLFPYALSVTSGTTETYLVLKDVSYIREVYPDKTDTSIPKYYAIFSDESFLLGPTPDQNYVCELHYLRRPESIVTASTSWLGDNAESCLLYACLVEAYTYVKGEADMIQLYESKYKEALSELKDLGEGQSQTDDYRGKTLRSPRR